MQSSNKNTIHDIFSSYFEDILIQKSAYFVSKKLEEGNICLDLNQHNKIEKEKLNIEKLKKSPLIVNGEKNETQPFVLLNDKLYLHRYFSYETIILNKISSLISKGNENLSKSKQELLGITDFINDVFYTNNDHNLKGELNIPWQLIASLKVILSNFTIITGGPGTGKTTTIAKFLTILFKLNPNISIALAAPTGKAAARLNESLISTGENLKNIPDEIKVKFSNLKAQTIHRLLGVKYNTPNFKHNKKRPLNFDIIIVDESSMIDTALMAKLIEAVNEETKLVLLGDKDQLASIEAGSIFGDLCKSQHNTNQFSKKDILFFNKFIHNKNSKISNNYFSHNTNALSGNIIELKLSYRFKNNEGIGKFSNLVISGITDINTLIVPFRQCTYSEQCVKISSDYKDLSLKEMLKYYEEYAFENNIEKALKKLNNIKILCAVREGEYGIYHYNKLIENHLKSKKLLSPKLGFYDKQAIMITSNDYSLGLFNGDIGIVKENKKTKQKRVYFKDEDGKLKDFPTVNISNYETVFAMTIHKSQGSEFSNIILVLPKDSKHKLLSRELIYTAVTRAKNQVLILSSDDVLVKAVNRKINRVSGINERLNT